MRTLYPELTPFNSFYLNTSTAHAVYVELSGNPQGFPVIFLHGGPCSGTKPDHRRFFNPELYQIILFDQRGCGQSLPFGELTNNTTQDLIDDMERIRKKLQIKEWLVFGGSWGAALALLYSQKYPTQVAGLILRAVFLARQQDIDWFSHYGAPKIYPERWESFCDALPNKGGDNPMQTLFATVWDHDPEVAKSAAREWMAWSGQVALGNLYSGYSQDCEVTDKMLLQVRMELHYAKNQYFIEENQILENCHKLANISAIIIHGRNDLVCPIEAGLKLHRALPQAKYIVLPQAGHIAQSEDMIDALVVATDSWIKQRQEYS